LERHGIRTSAPSAPVPQVTKLSARRCPVLKDTKTKFRIAAHVWRPSVELQVIHVVQNMTAVSCRHYEAAKNVISWRMFVSYTMFCLFPRCVWCMHSYLLRLYRWW